MRFYHVNYTQKQTDKINMSAITDPNSKEQFLKLLKGKEVARDKFGTTINIDDIIVYGSGAKCGPDLYYGLVSKINYNRIDEKTGEEKVSTVGIRSCQQGWGADKTYKLNLSRTSLKRWENVWVITEFAPQEIKDAIKIGKIK